MSAVARDGSARAREGAATAPGSAREERALSRRLLGLAGLAVLGIGLVAGLDLRSRWRTHELVERLLSQSTPEQVQSLQRRHVNQHLLAGFEHLAKADAVPELAELSSSIRHDLDTLALFAGADAHDHFDELATRMAVKVAERIASVQSYERAAGQVQLQLSRVVDQLQLVQTRLQGVKLIATGAAEDARADLDLLGARITELEARALALKDLRGVILAIDGAEAEARRRDQQRQLGDMFAALRTWDPAAGELVAQVQGAPAGLVGLHEQRLRGDLTDEAYHAHEARVLGLLDAIQVRNDLARRAVEQQHAAARRRLDEAQLLAMRALGSDEQGDEAMVAAERIRSTLRQIMLSERPAELTACDEELTNLRVRLRWLLESERMGLVQLGEPLLAGQVREVSRALDQVEGAMSRIAAARRAMLARESEVLQVIGVLQRDIGRLGVADEGRVTRAASMQLATVADLEAELQAATRWAIATGGWVALLVLLLSLVVIRRTTRLVRAARRELVEARDRALEYARLKTEFVSMISHELRTPMIGIIGMSELLLRSELAAPQREAGEIVLSSAQAQLSLLNDLLDFSRLEAGKLDLEQVAYSPRAVIQSVLDLLRVRAQEKQVELVARVDEQVPQHLEGDPGRLQQILFNLVGNALKFTLEGSVRLSLAVQGEQLRFEVRDTGIGVAPEAQARLFQPFMQADSSTSRRFGGSGLGLSICKHLVDLLGGAIGLESVPGVGSTFWFTLPLRLPAAPPAPAAAPSAPARLEGRGLVLLAEDHDVNRVVIMAQLAALGVPARAVANGREAVEAVRTEEFALVLMDCQMPELDGFEATRAIRELEAAQGRHVAIVALTAAATDGSRERCLAAGMDDYLSKPFSTELFVRTLNRWLPTAIAAPPVKEPASRSEVLDPTYLERMLGSEAAQRVLRDFLTATEEDLAMLRRELGQRDADALARRVHAIKGASANLRALEMAHSCRQLERAVGGGDWKECESEFMVLTSAFARVREVLDVA